MRVMYKIRCVPLLIGIAIMIIGFYFLFIKAGLPYQDPTPAMAEKYMFYMNTGDALLIIGFSIFVIGVILFFAFNLYKKRINKKASKYM